MIRPILTNSDGWKRPITGSVIQRLAPVPAPPNCPATMIASRIATQAR